MNRARIVRRWGMDKLIEDRYLGDGVYASFDGYHIILDTRAQKPVNRIALDALVMIQLEQFQQDVIRASAAIDDAGAASSTDADQEGE